MASLAASDVIVVNTILALNEVGTWPLYADVQGQFKSLGCNLVGNTSGGSGFSTGSGDLLNTPPLLLPLAHNGGRTLTHALMMESPAVNAGVNAYAITISDQRGWPRVICTNVDIGAYELDDCQSLLPHPAAKQALYFGGIDDHVLDLL